MKNLSIFFPLLNKKCSQVLFGLLCLTTYLAYAEAEAERVSYGNRFVSAKANIYGANQSILPAPGGGGGAGILPAMVQLPSGGGLFLRFPQITGKVACTDTDDTSMFYNKADGGSYCLGNTLVQFAEGGLSGVFSDKSMFLVGVFISNLASSDHSLPADANFWGANEQKFFFPQLNQVFFIGDGYSSYGHLQTFQVPQDATHLFLGFADGNENGQIGFYGDNSGALSVDFEIYQFTTFLSANYEHTSELLTQDQLTVSAKANIYGAGQTAPPASAGGGSGILPPLIPLPAEEKLVLRFPSITGKVSCAGKSNRYNTASGGNICADTAIPFGEGGLSGIDTYRTMFLTGVFLTDAEPQSITPPEHADLSANEFDTTFDTTAVTPHLNQLFFIGDGLIHNKWQYFYPPEGATRLFLGFVDGKKGLVGLYDDNLGQLTVQFEISRLVQASSTALALDKGLIAHYKFDGDLRDSQGNYHGQLNKTYSSRNILPAKKFIIGRFEQAFILLDEKVLKLLNNPKINIYFPWQSNWSLSAWFVNKHPFFYKNQKDCFRFFRIPAKGSDFSKFDLAVNEWYHAAVVGYLGKTQYYINGHQVGQSHEISPNFIYAGNCKTSIILDDFRVYNRALSKTEIKALAKTDLNQTPLIAEYNFPSKPSLPILGMVYSKNKYEVNYAEEVGTLFTGGFTVNEQSSSQYSVYSSEDIVKSTGEIFIDSADVGQKGDIFVYAEVNFAHSSEIRYFMLTEQGQNILPWDHNPANLVPFKHNILLSDYQIITLYEGYFDFQGIVKIFFGYRLLNGTVVTSPKSIDLKIFRKPALTGIISKMSVTKSNSPVISADGRYVAFVSWDKNQISDDTNEIKNVFVHNIQTGETTLVSVDSYGIAGNNDSFSPTISADGRYVAFVSVANNLVLNDTNDKGDVFVHDTQTKETTRISITSNGIQGNTWSHSPAISADGRYVAFSSNPYNILADETNVARDILVHDRQTQEITRVSVDSQGTPGNQDAYHASISADGHYVVFESEADNLVPNDSNRSLDVFLHDKVNQTTTLVSISSHGVPGNDHSCCASLSADGRYIAFSSSSDNLVPNDTNGYSDIFVHDHQTGETIRVSVDSNGIHSNGIPRNQGNQGGSKIPSISADGRYIVFESQAYNLVPNTYYSDRWNIFVHDRQSKETSRISVGSNGWRGNGNSSSPSISADGHYVVFESEADNLVPNDTNDSTDIFLYARQ